MTKFAPVSRLDIGQSYRIIGGDIQDEREEGGGVAIARRWLTTLKWVQL